MITKTDIFLLQIYVVETVEIIFILFSIFFLIFVAVAKEK